jgi:23S rRNA (guanosine2251-2'-O)-methyltransferase
MRRQWPRPGRATEAVGHGELIYGWHAALAALQNPRRLVRRVLVTRNARNRLRESIPTVDLPDPVDARDIERLTGPNAVHQGVAVLCDPLPEPGMEACARTDLAVVLDQVTDPQNVGAVLRSSSAFGAGAVVVTARHAPRDTPVLAKAASGALEHVALVRVPNLARALAELGEMGFQRIGLDGSSPDPIEAALPAERAALVLGAEGKGLRRLTAERCDRLVRIPTSGPVATLNVSNAAAVALYVARAARRG